MANKLLNPIVQIRYQSRGKNEVFPALPVDVAGNQTTKVGKESFTLRKNFRKGEDPCILILDTRGSIHHLYVGRPVVVKMHGASYTFVLENDISTPDTNPFIQFVKWSFGVHIFALIAFALYSTVAPVHEKKTTVSIDQQRIAKLKEKIQQIKKPKPKKKEVTKPKPKEVVKLEKPKPKPKVKPKPKQKRVAKAVSKPVRAKPKKKIVKKPKPAPRRAVTKSRVKTKKAKRPSKRPVIAKKRIKRPSAAEVAKKKAAAAAKRRAAKKAKLAKSLNFLSSSPGKFSVKTTSYNKVDKKYKGGAAAGKKLGKGGKYLNKLANTNLQEGAIQTKGSRNIAGVNLVSGSDLRDAKSLNRVQARVSVANLRGSGSFGGGYMDGGLNVSGKGRVDESAIMKAIQKHLQKLQYCYEKALLRDPSLAGNVMMGWTISGGGSASRVKVVRSQLKNAKLHGCISAEIARIKFPRPKGGSVKIKYPFSFSSSSL